MKKCFIIMYLENDETYTKMCKCLIYYYLILLHPERPKLYAVLVFLSAIGLSISWNFKFLDPFSKILSIHVSVL